MRYGVDPVLEAVEENPFLKSFYRDRNRFAFQTQLFFLLSRHAQQMELKQPDLFREVVDRGLRLPEGPHLRQSDPLDHELAMYNRIANILGARGPGAGQGGLSPAHGRKPCSSASASRGGRSSGGSTASTSASY